ncbi:hypothetical protein VMT65_29050 [Nocardia sp. CDC153]|uniref:hypothetical protein n=1 Tax=Nocardia sp. CDC153 TaxID=3112167 RepID=UPI002DBCE05E|nr:hypothetical protein [Nocardia sp. CDC153]MEC3957115.1 hypothetical protein [Nocardia sp. CDC153]
MPPTTGDPRKRADLDNNDPEFADEHQAVTTDHQANGETESPDGVGGMDPNTGPAV